MKKIEFITPDKFDSMVDEILKNNGISLEWSDSFSGINIDEIIEFGYNLEIEPIDLTAITNNEDVLAAISAEKRKIYLNEAKMELFNRNEGLLRFTKAHELGHWVLHVDKTSLDLGTELFGVEGINYICRNNKRDQREVQADMFAARILMPKSLLTEAFISLENYWGRFEWKQFFYIRDKFNVSKAALIIRLNELNLCYIPSENYQGKIYRDKAEYMGQGSLF